MQNFTLGRKGLNWILFTFILFVGSLSSYGQCPTVSDPDQEFCYLDRVEDLEATAAPGKTLRFYRTETSTNPIPNDEILENGTYFAGNEDGSCKSRPAINVTVSNLGPPVSEFGNFFEPCVYSEGDVTTVGDLKELITPSDPDYDLNVYANEFGEQEDELSDETPLQDGENYFIGQDDPDDECRYSSRIAIEYNPVEAFAPNADPSQEFCESDNPTVGDLMASATSENTQAFRWYSTSTSQPPLSDSTPLVNGETYFASQIVNRTNSTQPPCESQDRARVMVTILPSDAGPDNTDNVLCVSEADSELNNTTNARDFFLSLLTNNSDDNPDNDVPTDGTFSDDSLAQIVSDYNDGTKVDTYQTTYSVTFDNGCTDSVVLAVRVEEDPFAGEDTQATACISDFEAFLPLDPAFIPAAEDFIQDFIEGSDITEGGTFSPSISELFEQINEDFENDNFPASYSVTYTVDNGGCTDSSELTLNVQSSNDAGEDNSASLCETEVEDMGIFESEEALRSYYIDLLGAEDTDGTFNPSLSDLIANYNDGIDGDSEDFETTYTVDGSSECDPASATASLTVNASEPAEAGTIEDQILCSTEESVDLKTFLGTDSMPGGTFSTDDDITISDDDTINPSETGAGTYSFTYTVSEEDEESCATGTSSEEFNITIDMAPNAGEDDSETLCQTQVEEMGIFENEENLRTYFINLLGAEDTDGTFDPSLSSLVANYNDGVTGSEDFMTTYTVDNSEVCDPASATAALTVNEATEANAGTADENYEFCSNDPVVTLADLVDGENPDGVFSSDNADVADGTFDPSAEGAGTYEITYTVSPETACVTDTATLTFTITVNEAPNAGPGGNFEFCQAEFIALAAQIAANPEGEGIELLNEFDPTITPGGNFTDSTLDQLLAQYTATTSFPATFTTTYTVSNENCTDSAEYSITINPNEEADAGGDQNAAFCTTEAVVDLSGSIGAGATAGGTFTSEDLTLTGSTFDASAAGAGTFTVIYTVDETTDPCITGTDTAEITVTVSEGFELGDDVSMIVCENDLEDDFFTVENLTEEFTALLPADAPDGTFSPEISDLVDDFNNGKTTGDFETTYSIENGACEDSVKLTITIRENIDAELTEVEDPAPICQNAGIQNLTDFIGDNPDFGTFEGYEEGTFDPSMMAAGDYEITYTLSEDEDACVSGTDSISFTITVLDSANAGEDMDLTVCMNDDVQNLFDLLEGDTVDMDGNFTFEGETIEDGMMDPANFEAGTYEITYTVASENDCGNDTATFMITVNMTPDAGMDMAFEVCQNAGIQNLFDQLDDSTSDEGSFTLNGDTIADGEMNPADFEPGTYTVTYTLSNENCTDTSDFTITVLDAANAGEDMDISVCMNDDVQNLFEFLSVDADTNGEFTLDGELIADGMMNPADFEAGEYEVVYTVPAINDCGDDSATFNITVEEAPEAPTVDGNPFTFCATDEATVADLSASGTNLTFYSDEALSMMVAPEDALVAGTYYVTQRNDEGSCESEATEITVNINDAATPTISDTTPEFCSFDDATIADLTDLINETGTITWYDSEDGDNALNSGTSLQDGVTYYATLFNVDTGCESSVRLAVTVTIDDDCPLIIPEGFSPNGDGLNDTFEIRNIRDKYPNFTIEIRNRFGDVVYKGNANTPDWDGFSTEGSFGSGVLPVGAYFYYLRYNDGSTVPVRGTVYLSR